MGAQGVRGTPSQKGKFAHRIMRVVATVERLSIRELAEGIGENYFRVRNEVLILRGAGLLVPKIRYLALTNEGSQVVTRLRLR